MPHWRSLVSNDYVCAADLFDEKAEAYRELTATIERVEGGTIVGQGGRKSKRPFIYFAGSKTGKPLGLNSTNSKSICTIAGSEDYKRWIGVRITLFVTKTRDPESGGMIDCIRIKQPAGTTAPAQPAGEPDGAMSADKAASECA